MNLKSLSVLGAALAAAFVFGGLSVWVYQKAAAFDEGDNQVSFKGKIMERKSDALQDLLDAVLRGNLKGAGAASLRLQQYSATIDGFLDSDMYVESGQAYTSALQQFREAASGEDWEAVKSAVIAIERSCLECHQVLLAASH